MPRWNSQTSACALPGRDRRGRPEVAENESEKLWTARWACSHSIPGSVITVVSGDHFKPQYRLAFACRFEWTANRNRTDCEALTSGVGAKFFGKILPSATYGHIDA
jgi:hypothetical protein